MKKINEYQFKSIGNSKNEEGKSWCILNHRIVKTPACLNSKRYLSFYRRIVYLDSKKQPYQIGSVSYPIGFRNFLLSIRLFFSRKTFGHYMSGKYKEIEFEPLSTEMGSSSYNILFNKSAVQISKRLISVPKIKFSAYVEEERLHV